MSTSHSIEVEEKDRIYAEKMKKLKDKHAKRLEKMGSEFQNLLDQRMEEVHTQSQMMVNHAKINEQETIKTLESKQSQMDQQYIKINEHEALMQERANFLMKEHEVELLSLTQRYEADMCGIKNALEKELSSVQSDKINQLETCKKQVEETLKSSKSLKKENDKGSVMMKDLRLTLDQTRDSLRLAERDLQELGQKYNELCGAHSSMLPKFDRAQQKKGLLKNELVVKLEDLMKAEEQLAALSQENGAMKSDLCVTEKENHALKTEKKKLVSEYRDELDRLKNCLTEKAEEDEKMYKKVFHEKVSLT